ncbi:MAG: hypothetical protein AVDCRST_MAG31-2561 [uncultured Sphingomonas sp.]|uniref:Uncharacterized protein n=1 Tax=uncultured Sphingomonas sp. TaxID=158754 RepID=A0A6J4TWS8_9SPHN|nr:hypothetical protein [uncultured Sphingomonas sp.]CAA9532876.1 MAG: hypothetical protein AVDCRST_MAG31-2561 [uncultured Sphingomonas sp.]
MQILTLDNGGASLEFTARETPAVLESLKRAGAVRSEQGACYDAFSLAGEQIVFYFEWDEPCLIANTPGGVALLRRLAADLDHLRAA